MRRASRRAAARPDARRDPAVRVDGAARVTVRARSPRRAVGSHRSARWSAYPRAVDSSPVPPADRHAPTCRSGRRGRPMPVHRPCAGGRLADGLPVGCSRPRCWTTGTKPPSPDSWRRRRRRRHLLPATASLVALEREHRRRFRRLRTRGARPTANRPPRRARPRRSPPCWWNRGGDVAGTAAGCSPRWSTSPGPRVSPDAHLAAREPTPCPRASSSPQAGSSTAGPGPSTPAARRCARLRRHALLDGVVEGGRS